MSDSVWPQRQQPTRLPHPWDSPGKNTGVGCHFLLQCMKVKSECEGEAAQSCPTLRDPMDCSLPGSSTHGIFQARVLEWGAIAFCISKYSIRPLRLISLISPDSKSPVDLYIICHHGNSIHPVSLFLCQLPLSAVVSCSPKFEFFYHNFRVSWLLISKNIVF